MSQRFEGHFQGFDETELFFQTWKPDRVRGAFVITHGLAEHSECYHPLAKILVEDGWQVFAWDLRGHGRSEGKRGYVRHLSDYVDDFKFFYQTMRKQAPVAGSNTVFFGHSMGGLVSLRFLQTQKVEYGALCLSSPALGLSMQVPKIKEALAHFAVRWLPSLTLFNEIQYQDLSRDEEMRKSYGRDNLRHDKISPGLFLSMLETFTAAASAAASISGPVLMQLAGEDRLVSVEAARSWFEKLSNKKNQLIVYPESYHEVFNDLDREEALADLKRFIHPYLGA